jgi:hypothetical protein
MFLLLVSAVTLRWPSGSHCRGGPSCGSPASNLAFYFERSEAGGLGARPHKERKIEGGGDGAALAT